MAKKEMQKQFNEIMFVAEDDCSNVPNNRPPPTIINFKDFSKSQNQKSQIFCMEQQKGVNELLSKYT